MFAIFFSSHYSLLIPPEYRQSENMFYSLLVAMTQLNNCAGVNPKPLLFVPLNSLPSKAQYEQQLIFKQSPANPYHGPPLHLRIWAIGLYTMVISMWKSLLYPPIFSIHILPSTFTLIELCPADSMFRVLPQVWTSHFYHSLSVALGSLNTCSQ